jgi:two-component system NtrC family sensor kinase
MSHLERLMLDCSPTMMLLVDPVELRIVVANQAARQILGYSEEQLLAMKITGIESSLQDVFYWEDVSRGQFLEIESQEGIYQCADDSLLTVMKSVRIVHDGALPMLLVQASDVRHERAVEDTLAQTLSQLRATLESTGNGILVVDWRGDIANMNKLFSQIWDLPEAILLAGDDAAIFEFITQRVSESAACHARLHAVVGADETEDVYHLHDGRVLECRSRPQFLGERIIGRVFGFSDITQRKLAEAALRESRDMLEERVRERTADLQMANATLETKKAQQAVLIDKLEQAQTQLLQSEKMATIGQLAAGVAHEINNPVAFVNSNLGTLRRYVDDLLELLAAYAGVEASLAPAERGEIGRLKTRIDPVFLREDIDSLLAESLDGVARVKSIVQDLKDFSHVDESERHWANLEEGLDSTLRLVANEFKFKVEVVKEYGGIPPIECLASQLNQVFMNLLVNASHAIDERGRITVRTGMDIHELWVEVADTGKGIKPEHLSRIFEPFFTTKPVGKGTGLGLSLSYGIVQKHAGRIEVESVIGEGTRFRVVLPRVPAAPAA